MQKNTCLAHYHLDGMDLYNFIEDFKKYMED